MLYVTGKSKTPGSSKSEDVFGDLLGSQGYSFSAKKDTGPRTMNEMRKEELVREMDPDKIKVRITLFFFSVDAISCNLTSEKKNVQRQLRVLYNDPFKFIS